MEIMEKCYVYQDCEEEAQRFKWIESEKAGHDLGEMAVRHWVQKHWWGYLRARWLEHLQGRRFWVELDRGDFGLLQRDFQDQSILLDRILDRIKAGQENPLDIILWALQFGIPDPKTRPEHPRSPRHQQPPPCSPLLPLIALLLTPLLQPERTTIPQRDTGRIRSVACARNGGERPKCP